jgi:hypothetical protein
VIACGVLTLGTITPRVALANPCAPIVRFDGTECFDPTSACQSFALPGCTVTSASCSAVSGRALYSCHYGE